MQTTFNLYPKLTDIIYRLPPDALDELARFLEDLQAKYQHSAQASTIATLGGLWADVAFEIDDAEIRELRHKLSIQALVAN